MRLLPSEEKPTGLEFELGPWRFGRRVNTAKVGDPSKPHDKRLNLYIVLPGRQFSSADDPQFDHNLVINAKPAAEADSEFDVYYAVFLDPRHVTDVRRERDIILAAQTHFMPGDLFEFNDVPAAEMLRRQLQWNDMRDLRPYRRRDGALPRLLILPVNAVLRVRGEASSILENQQ